MRVLRPAVLLLIISLSGTAYGSTELGEYCFSGSFLKDGNCNVRLEVTQHSKYFSLSGIVACDVQNNSDGVSGVASGAGHIEGDIFRGSLVIPHEFGQVGVSLSQVSTNSMNFDVNLNNLNTVFRKTTTSQDLCGESFLATCIEEAVFTFTVCP